MKPSAAEAQALALSKKWGERQVGPKCSIGKSDLRPLIEALSRRLTSSRVSEVLFIEKSIRIGREPIARHKRGDCRCVRT